VALERNAPVHRGPVGRNALEAVYPHRSAASVYTAAVCAATELGFVITDRNDAALALAFRTAGPTPSWPGRQMTAQVHPQADAARIVVVGTSVTGYRLMMADWHQAEAIGVLFLNRVTAVLPTVPEPERPGPSPVDQLRALADLHDRRLLTDDEFAVAKNKLLSPG
jgi:hypothetical protein